MEDPIEVVVTLDDRALDHMPAVVDKLKAAGLEVVNVLDITGQVVGKWPKASDVKSLNKVEGVLEAVESQEMEAI